MGVVSLGTITETPLRELSDTEYYCALLDFYDHWTDVDGRMERHHLALSPWAEACGHDLVNLATYANEVMERMEPSRIREGSSVVVAGSMIEAFVVSLRSMADAVAGALAYVASSKAGQAPTNSLNALIAWSKKHPNRVRHSAAEILSRDFSWFCELRTFRDQLVHCGAIATIHSDGHQFNLWMHSPAKGWLVRTPLLPWMRDQFLHVTNLANDVASVIRNEIDMPADREGSRVVQGVLIPALHKLIARAELYDSPSP